MHNQEMTPLQQTNHSPAFSHEPIHTPWDTKAFHNEKATPEDASKSEKSLKDFQTLQQRVSRLEADKQRPRLWSVKSSPVHETNDFSGLVNEFVRKGLDCHGIETKSLSSLDPSGADLINRYVSSRIQDYITSDSPLRSLSSSMTITTDSVDILVEQSAPEVGWVGEKDARKETKTPEIVKQHIKRLFEK